MAITLSELLTLVGPLDDSTGFDTARERYRRFILEQVTTAASLRAFVDDCQHALDDQQHRALQDLVVLIGRSLGFDTRFGAYAPSASQPGAGSLWLSRTGLEVPLEIRTAQTGTSDVESLSGAVAARLELGPASRAIGLCVTTPLFSRRDALDGSVAAAHVAIRVVSLRALMAVTDLVEAGTIDHDDVVRLLRAGNGLDGVIDLVSRVGRAPAAVRAPAPAAPERPARTGFWLATVSADPAITPEQFLERVVGKRQIFGVSGDVDGAAMFGDAIGFYVKEKGVLGQARVAGTVKESSGLRDAHQYCQILRLTNVALHTDRPLRLDAEASIRLRAAGTTIDGAPALRRVTQQEFTALTTPRGEPHGNGSHHDAGSRLDREGNDRTISEGSPLSRA